LNKYQQYFTEYINSQQISDYEFSFCSNQKPSYFSNIFGLFNLNLINKINYSYDEKECISKKIKKNLDTFKSSLVKSKIPLSTYKPYLQLLTFSLTALKLVDKLDSINLEHHILPLIPKSIQNCLSDQNVHIGYPKSGNYAMFMAILLIHANEYLNSNQSAKIEEWVDYHIKHINRFGFWGDHSTMSHLQFQNGYHQYEIFDYLGVKNPKFETAADAVASLADSRGRFAPYPGGGGCYDYDSIAIITSCGANVISKHRNLLNRTYSSILEDQNDDGGFCESKYIRPRTLHNFLLSLKHGFNGKGTARNERFRQAITLQRPKYNRVMGASHWTTNGYNRRWDESNLWDSYFRMSAIARIELALNYNSNFKWNFVDYPGIGFHETSREKA
jgi:hypothetical protein